MNSATDYYPFGMVARKYAGLEQYRYGFNTQEEVEELGEGHTTAEYWEYDARLGRRWNLDPKPHNGISPYACFLNSPILLDDPDGDLPPWLLGFGLGAGAEIAGQVAANMVGGMGLYDAVANIDIADVLISGVEGAITLGGSASGTFTKAMVKNGIKRAVKVALKGAAKPSIIRKAAKIVAIEAMKTAVDVHKTGSNIEVTVYPVDTEFLVNTGAAVVGDVAGGIIGDAARKIIGTVSPKTIVKVFEAPDPKASVKALRESQKVISTEERLAAETEAIKNMVVAEEATKMANATPGKATGEVIESKLQSNPKGFTFKFNPFARQEDFQKRVKQNQRRSKHAKAQIRRKWN